MVRARPRLAHVAAAICVECALSLRNLEPAIRSPFDFNATLAFFDGRFQLVQDLGYMRWYANCSGKHRSRSYFEDVSLEELRRGFDADDAWRLPEARPPKLGDLDGIRGSLPRLLAFGRNDASAGYYYRPPHAMPSVAAPIVASQRFNLSKIDFILGASLLDTLATGDFAGKDYTVQKWHGAVMIRSADSGETLVDLKDKGFQLERLVTARDMDDIAASEVSVQHLQVLRLGKFNVLCIGKVDAMDGHGRLAEVTTVFTPTWRKLIFKMFAKGSTKLVRGLVIERWPKLYLNELGEYELRDIIEWTTTNGERRLFAANILHSLWWIRSRLQNMSASEGAVFRMNETKIHLRPRSLYTHSPKLYAVKGKTRSMLPSAGVMRALFPKVA